MNNKDLNALKYCWEDKCITELGKDKLIKLLFKELSKYRVLKNQLSKGSEPKEGDTIKCPECGETMKWVSIGEPEGEFYSCEYCNYECDENLKELK